MVWTWAGQCGDATVLWAGHGESPVGSGRGLVEECRVTVTWEPWSPGQGREEGEGMGHVQPPAAPGLLALILEPTTMFSEHSTSSQCPLSLVSEHLEFSCLSLPCG